MLKRENENEEQHDHSNKQKKIKKEEDAIGNLFFKNMLVIILV